MKYGKINYNYGDFALRTSGYNIGDAIQTIALEQIYKYIGLRDSDVIEIDLCDINTYDGEYVLLPIYSVTFGIGFLNLPFSPKIVPIFISSHIAKTELDEIELNYLKSYAPIGCRDEYSLNICHKYGIPSYLSGCITVIFPLRKTTPDKEKIFFVDTPDSLLDYIPKNILKTSEFTTHLTPVERRIMNTQDGKINYEISKQQLKKYFQEATMVVSSRLHAIVPCMAAGIPVIAACENISQRFSWVDKFVRIYSQSEFDKIDWYPKPIEYEQMKAKMLDFFANKIRTAFENNRPSYTISDFYENREKALYGSLYLEKLSKLSSTTQFDYLIWGCGLIGNTVYTIMQDKFPKAKLVVAVDNFVSGIWHGVEVIKPSRLEQYKDKKIILATYSGKEECYKKMQELGLKEDLNFIYIGTQNG